MTDEVTVRDTRKTGTVEIRVEPAVVTEATEIQVVEVPEDTVVITGPIQHMVEVISVGIQGPQGPAGSGGGGGGDHTHSAPGDGGSVVVPVDNHLADAVDAHDAAAVSFNPTGLQIVAATNVQDAIEELDDELDAHEVDTSDAHDATAISVNPAGSLTSTDVQTALEELATEAAAAEQDLDDHLSDPIDAHDASSVSVTPVGTISATDVQAAITELASDAQADAQALADHIADASDAHDASAISNVPTGTIGSSNVQDAINELASDSATDAQNLADHIVNLTDAHDASAISVTPVGDVSASDVQAAIAELAAEKATTQYVDDSVAGLSWKAPVRAATTANITLSGPQTIDGVSVIAGDRVLVKEQTLSEQNGIYVVAAGVWTRATDANTAAEILQASVFVEEGTVNGDRAFVLTTNVPLVLNTTPLTFAPFGFAGTPTGPAGGVLSGTYPNPGFAVDMATQAELDAHINDTVDAHDASAISVVPTGTIAATDVQSALAELDAEKTTLDAVSWKRPVRVATSVAGVLATDFDNGSVIGATGLVTGDRILIKDQAVVQENGIYVVNASGPPTRASDADVGTELLGAIVYVYEGVNARTVWFCDAVPTITIGASGLAWRILSFDHDHSANGDGHGGRAIYPESFGTTNVISTTLMGGSPYHNWDPGPWASRGLFIIVTNANTFPTVITGLAAPTDAKTRICYLVNKSPASLVLNDQSASSSVGNRFHIPSGLTTFTIPPGQTGMFIWMPVGGVDFWVVVDELRVHSHTSDSDGGALNIINDATEAALIGTVGVPQSTNPFVTNWDPHESDGPILNGGFEVWTGRDSIPAIPTNTEFARKWVWSNNTDGVATVSKVLPGITVGNTAQKFRASVEVDITTIDASVGATQNCFIRQIIEGYSGLPYIQKGFSLSFWVFSSKAGVHCVAFRNNSGDRSYVAEYTVDVANTWEYKTVSIAASPSAGGWNYDINNSFNMTFALAIGSNFHTAAGAWQTGNFLATANQVNLFDNTANVFALTGVRISLGSVPAPYVGPGYALPTVGYPSPAFNPYVSMQDPHDPGIILNGGMNIAQRPTVAAIPNAGYAPCDQWQYTKVGAMVHDAYQDAVAPPSAFFNFEVPGTVQNQKATYSLLLDCVTADTSIAAGDFCAIQQNVEEHLWNAVQGRPFTVGFWVKDTITGIHCFAIRGSGGVSYVAEYTVNASNTWEYKTITIAPGASGATAVLCWTLAAGSTYQTTKEAWNAGTFFATANQVNSCSSTSNFFSLWGVKLCLGYYVSPYIARPYTDELLQCKRYLHRISNAVAAYKILRTGQAISTTQARFELHLPVAMRVAPTLSASAAGDFVLSTAPYGVQATNALVAAGGVGQDPEVVSFDATATAAVLVAGNACQILLNNAAGNKWIQWSAEI